MIRYIVLKIIFTLAVLTSVSFITFVLTFLVPSDPARALLGTQADESSLAALRKELKLDRSLPVQYAQFLLRTVKGDLGRSYVSNQPVAKLIVERLPATAILGFFALLPAVILGISVGCLLAYFDNNLLSRLITSSGVFVASIPVFFLGLLFSLVFGSYFGLFPVSGYAEGFKGIDYLVLPCLTLCIYPMVLIIRLTLGDLRKIMAADYVRTHFAMGFPRWRVILKYALRNAMIPVVTVIGNSIAVLLSGAFFVEYIFSWPGIGLLWVDAVLRYDFPVIMGVVMFSATIFVSMSFVIDMLYPVIDPRVRVGKKLSFGH